MSGVRTWIDRLGLSIKDAARHVGIEADQLERVLKFPEDTLPVRVVLQILEGLGLGLAGVDELSPVAVLRHLDQQREAKGISKKSLAASAELNRPYMTALFQELKPEPRLETIMKMAGALEVVLVIEKRRELEPLAPPAPAPPSPPRPPSTVAQTPPPTPATGTAAPPGSSNPDEPRAAPPLAETSRPTATSTRPTSVAAATTADVPIPSPNVRTTASTPPIIAHTVDRSSGASDQPSSSLNVSKPAPVPQPPAAAPSASPTPSPATPAGEAGAHTTAPTTASPRVGASAKQTPTAANEPPMGSAAAATTAAAAAAAGATVAAGRWLSDAAFARLTEEAAAAKVRIAEEQHRTAMVRQEMEHARQLGTCQRF